MATLQLSLLSPERNAVDLTQYDLIVLNSSAGKDSQAMIDEVTRQAKRQGVPKSRMVVVHADLGRVEWKGTAHLAEQQAERYGLRFEIVRRPQGDLLDAIRNRGKWPSPAQRYCTSYFKRDQVRKFITASHREHTEATGRKNFRVLNCMGLRAEESTNRAKKNSFIERAGGSTKFRQVDEWLPVHDWLEGEIWHAIRKSGVPYHWAYDLGMPRLSCVLCFFSNKETLVLAGKHNPELLAEYVALETEMGHIFKADLSLATVQELVQIEAA